MKIHCAFMTPKYMNMILSGQKTIESRFYSTMRNHPAMSCYVGDYILFKRTGGDGEARAKVAAVHCFYSLSPEEMQDIAAKYNDRICAENSFWESKSNSVQGILIELTDVVPIHIAKTELPSTREGWAILDDGSRGDVIDLENLQPITF